jgi:hypothetical protein
VIESWVRIFDNLGEEAARGILRRFGRPVVLGQRTGSSHHLCFTAGLARGMLDGRGFERASLVGRAAVHRRRLYRL